MLNYYKLYTAVTETDLFPLTQQGHIVEAELKKQHQVTDLFIYTEYLLNVLVQHFSA